MSAENVTIDNFQSIVIENDNPVLIDFWAEWCGPCRAVSPIVDEIADELTNIKVCKINVDKNEDLAVRYNITSIPTLVLVENGKEVRRKQGLSSKEEIIDMIKDRVTV